MMQNNLYVFFAINNYVETLAVSSLVINYYILLKINQHSHNNTITVLNAVNQYRNLELSRHNA